MTELKGPLRYLIGTDKLVSEYDVEGVVVEAGYDVDHAPMDAIGIKYCNLLDEKNEGKYGPYVEATGTAEEYNEGVPDPDKQGFVNNIIDQCIRAVGQGFDYIEWDNPDDEHFKYRHLAQALEISQHHGLKVIFKNPAIIEYNVTKLIADPVVCGIIVEEGAGNPV